MTFSFPKFLLVIILLSLSMTSFLEATSTGFVAPLIHITSPEHPLYHPNRTRGDILRDSVLVSNERERYFEEKRRNFGNYIGVAPLNYHVVMKYYIGTPPVVTYAIPDTGSGVTWLQCQPCEHCYDQSAPIFDPSKSSTYELLLCASIYCKSDYGFHCGSLGIGCRYHLSYMDSSTTEGVVVKDTIMLPGEKYSTSSNLSIPNIVIGCGLYNNDPTSGVGGVIGLKNLSVSLPCQMGVHTFSYCVSDGGDGGYIRFGSSAILMGDNVSLFTTNKYFEYRSIMLDIIVGGTRLNLSSDIFKVVDEDYDTGVMVDTGAYITRLNPVAYNSMVDKITDIMIGHESYGVPPYYEVCYNALDYDTSVTQLPSVHFLFENNVTLKMPNENIWSEEDNDGNLCLKIFKSSSNITVIGAEQLKSYNVGFDLRGGKLWLDYQEDCRY